MICTLGGGRVYSSMIWVGSSCGQGFVIGTVEYTATHR